MCLFWCLFFFFKQKTAYEMRISDWSSDVCSSDLLDQHEVGFGGEPPEALQHLRQEVLLEAVVVLGIGRAEYLPLHHDLRAALRLRFEQDGVHVRDRKSVV